MTKDKFVRVGAVICGQVGIYPYSFALTKKDAIEKFNTENQRENIFNEAKKEEQLRAICLFARQSDLKEKQ